jgi:isoleucyl-tRNA synthetase
MAAAPLEGDIAIRAYSSGKPLKLDTRSGSAEVPGTAYQLRVLASEDYEVAGREGVFVAIGKSRDDKLVAEGLMRDVARRLQALRKTRGFSPTAMLREAAVAGLDEQDLALLRPLSKELAFLVRVRRVELSNAQTPGKKWAEDDLDGKPIFLDVG